MSEKQKHKKLRGWREGGGIERRTAKLAAGLLEGSGEAKVLWNLKVLVA